MTGLAAATAPAQSQALGTYIFAVASGLTVVMLGWIARSLRQYMKEHNWLMETTKANTEAIGKNTEAIRKILERDDRSPRRR